MKAEEKAQELYPNNKTFCGGVAQIARDAFAKGARMQKEVDDKELSEKVSAAYQLGLSDKEKQMMAGAVKMYSCYDEEHNLIGFSTDYEAKGAYGQLTRIIIENED